MATRNPSIETLVLDLGGKPAGSVASLQPPGYQVDANGSLALTAFEALFRPLEADALSDWIFATPQGGPTLDGAATVLDANTTITRRIEWSAGSISELHLPVLDAADRSPFLVGLRWQARSIAYATRSVGQKGSAPKAPKTARPMLCSNFRLAGLPFDASSTARIELPRVQAAAKGSGPAGLGELRVELGSRAQADALAWLHKQAQGPAALGSPLTLTVELLDAALKTPLLSVQLSGCSLLGAEESRLDPNDERLARLLLRFKVAKLEIRFK